MSNLKIEYFGIKTRIINSSENLVKILIEYLNNDESTNEKSLALQSGDIIVIASKIVAMEQNRIVDLKTINPSKLSFELANKANLPPEFVEIVINESDEIIGAVKGALLTLRHGDVQANAGVDKSNVINGKAILLPLNPNQYAEEFKSAIEKELKIKNIGVLVVDSSTRPLRIGTVGLALGSAGFPAIVDIRGQPDLFGNKMKITLRNIADNLACGANILMGESSESIPFVIIRGLQELTTKYNWNNNKVDDLKIDPKQCLYFGNMEYKSIKTFK